MKLGDEAEKALANIEKENAINLVLGAVRVVLVDGIVAGRNEEEVMKNIQEILYGVNAKYSLFKR